VESVATASVLSSGASGLHAKLDTTALYARVATKTIQQVMSPLEHIARKVEKVEPPT
jgi:hypothetical protein